MSGEGFRGICLESVLTTADIVDIHDATSPAALHGDPKTIGISSRVDRDATTILTRVEACVGEHTDVTRNRPRNDVDYSCLQ